jgi:hypothetical protein
VCEPPCLPESLPDAASVPIALPLILVTLAAMLGLPTLLLSAVRASRRRPQALATGLLVVAGPLLVLMGAEVIPHAANPCYFSRLETFCTITDQHGTDFADRFHALGHAVVGLLPLTAAYLWALHRSRPELLRR